MSNVADAEWACYEKLIAKARKMLAKPIAEAIVDKDETVRIKPTGWRFSDIARMAQIAIELGMLAIDSTTSRDGKAAISCRTGPNPARRLRDRRRSHGRWTRGTRPGVTGKIDLRKNTK